MQVHNFILWLNSRKHQFSIKHLFLKKSVQFLVEFLFFKNPIEIVHVIVVFLPLWLWTIILYHLVGLLKQTLLLIGLDIFFGPCLANDLYNVRLCKWQQIFCNLICLLLLFFLLPLLFVSFLFYFLWLLSLFPLFL